MLIPYHFELFKDVNLVQAADVYCLEVNHDMRHHACFECCYKKKKKSYLIPVEYVTDAH